MKPFVINRHGRLVFPSNFVPDLDFAVLQDLDALNAVIARDFEAKTPTGTDILERVRVGRVRDARGAAARRGAERLVWVNRYAMTMYEKRPARWREPPRRHDDVFLPVLTPWRRAAQGPRRRERLGRAPDRRRPRRGGSSACSSTSSLIAATTPPSCRRSSRPWRRSSRRPRRSPSAWPTTTPTTRCSASRRCATAARTCPSSSRCTGSAMVLHGQYQ